MRYGLFSDVHANFPALLRVLEALGRRGVDQYICAGDVIGYGPHPVECIEAVEALDASWVLGNHELLLLGLLPSKRASQLARRSLEWTRGVLPSSVVDRLALLPMTEVLPAGVVVAHASLKTPTLRVSGAPRVLAELDRLRRTHGGSRFLVLGHTHTAMVADHDTVRHPHVLSGRVRLDPARCYVVNPGSVGQSRSLTGHARAALLDTDANTLEMIAVRYETSQLVRDLEAAGLPRWTHHHSPMRRAAERVKRKARGWLEGRSKPAA
jgi:predicted phosphodiesterase